MPRGGLQGAFPVIKSNAWATACGFCDKESYSLPQHVQAGIVKGTY